MKTPSSIPATTGRILLGCATAISLYLACIALSRTSLPGCDNASQCQDIMQSRWAFAFGIPVSFLGFVLYAVALLLSWAFVRRERTFASLQGGMAISTIIAGGIWFTALQIFALHSLCLWCCITHSLAVSGALLLWHSRMQHPAPPVDCSMDLRDAGSPLSNDRIFRFTATGSALTAVGLLALGALSGPLHQSAPVVATVSGAVVTGPDRQLSLHGGKFEISEAEYPYIGSSAANARTAVLLSDYTCSWCREYHGSLENLARTSPEPLRITLMPVARTPEATDIQRIALITFHADREKWHALSALLTSGQIPATPDAAGKAALKLLGTERWTSAVAQHSATANRQLEMAAAVLKENSTESSTLPKLMSGNRVLTGAEPDTARILAFLKDAGGEAPKRQDPAAKLMVLTPEVTLDDLTPDKPRNVEIKVQNTGTAPLKLSWLAVEAGCEVTSLPPRTFYPGEIAVIGLKITPSPGETSVTRKVKIHSDAPGEPAVVTLLTRNTPEVAAGS